MGELARESRDVERRRRVASAGDGDGARARGVGHGPRDGHGAGVEGLGLERAHRAVPDHLPRRANRVGELRHAARADVEAHPAVGDAADHHLRLGAGLERPAADVVRRQHDGAPAGACVVQDGVCLLHHVGLDEALAGRDAFGAQERVGHGAADDDGVHLVEEVREGKQLVAHLRAADDRHERALRSLKRLAEEAQLSLEEPSGDGRRALRLHGDGKRHHRGIGAVRGAERVVHVGIGVGGELRGEGGVALLLALLEAQVLEKEHLPGPQRGHGGLRGVVGGHLAGEDHLGLAGKQLLQALEHRAQALAGLEAGAGRAAEVAGDDDRRTARDERLDGRQRAADAAVVGDGARVVGGDVEVGTDEDALSPGVERVDGSARGRAPGRGGGGVRHTSTIRACTRPNRIARRPRRARCSSSAPPPAGSPRLRRNFPSACPAAASA